MEYSDVVKKVIDILRRVLCAKKEHCLFPWTEISEIGEYGPILSEGLNSDELEDELERGFKHSIPKGKFNGPRVTVQTIIDFVKKPRVHRFRQTYS